MSPPSPTPLGRPVTSASPLSALFYGAFQVYKHKSLEFDPPSLLSPSPLFASSLPFFFTPSFLTAETMENQTLNATNI